MNENEVKCTRRRRRNLWIFQRRHVERQVKRRREGIELGKETLLLLWALFNPALTRTEVWRSHTHSKTLATGVAKMFPSTFIAKCSFQWRFYDYAVIFQSLNSLTVHCVTRSRFSYISSPKLFRLNLIFVYSYDIGSIQNVSIVTQVLECTVSIDTNFRETNFQLREQKNKFRNLTLASKVNPWKYV
jgi:hypothetical protein